MNGRSVFLSVIESLSVWSSLNRTSVALVVKESANVSFSDVSVVSMKTVDDSFSPAN